MREEIDQLRACIFDQDIPEYMRLMTSILGEAEKRMNSMLPKSIADCNAMLQLILAALQKRDYLNASDILKFDLCPLLEGEACR